MVEIFGDPQSFAIEVAWAAPQDSSTAAEFTYGSLRLLVASEVVWSGESINDGFDWTWIEIAESIAENWPWLTLEDGFPLGIRGGSLNEINAELRRVWDNKSEAVREQEGSRLYEYEEAHDLARGLQGAVVPPLWLVKEGKRIWVSSTGIAAVLRFEEVRRTLESFAEAIIDRALRSNDERAHDLVESWKHRAEMPEMNALEVATGLDAGVLAAIQESFGGQDLWGEADADLSNSEIIAAARMSAALPVADISAVLRTVRATGKSSTAQIEKISESVSDALSDGTPFDQGYAAATWLRDHLGKKEDEAVDPGETLAQWDVGIHDLSLSVSLIDAFACWGPSHGPAIYVNTSGRSAQSSAGRRSTLAHEICHLLLDRDGALPLVEVLGGRAPARVEERARAFAAEILAPREYVGRQFGLTDDARRLLDKLRRRFGVSAELIAWQAKNSSTLLSADARAFLRARVSQPWRF